MWDALHNAFYNALDKLDFKVGWTAEDLEEVRFLLGYFYNFRPVEFIPHIRNLHKKFQVLF